MKDELKGADIRVMAHESLDPEQGRALWAAYVKRGLERDKAKDALKDVFALIDDGFLVRNTDDDAKPDFALRMMSFIARLSEAYKAGK